MNVLLSAFLVLAFSLLSIEEAQSRPEYAVQHNIVSCTACHASPSGGGIRNEYGKLYGLARLGKKPNQKNISENAKFWAADFRAIYFIPEERTPEPPNYPQAKSGFGIMSSILSANAPVLSDDTDGSELSVVAAYNMGVFEQKMRESYLRYRPSEDGPYIVVGKFNAPFGLLTDEHRTYIRMQSRTSLNDFQSGAMISQDFKNANAHVDLALVNGLQSGPAEAEGSFSNGSTWGAFFNIRYSPNRMPFFVGTSAQYSERRRGEEDPWAYSIYNVTSLNQLTGYRIAGSLLFEFSEADNWNDNSINPDISRRVSSTLISTNALKTSTSRAWLGQLNLDLTRKWILTYKYESITLDKDFSGDAFERNGIGFKYFVNNNLILLSRAEFSKAGSDQASKFDAGDQDAYYMVLHMWL